ncbi:hypothetical protein [uncultured Kriegella sp.]|uniref:hypothetical protein n=1 Tax=uncultured Kriegella sp. TaxID=1798910 RepID=UPI0030DAB9E0|tara:strand:- start:197557 stop:198285 length:729 start_codon:yes stop_codon:yes gene_type:complete
MNKTALESFYNGLLPILWEELVFFIPDHIMTEQILENYEKFDFQKFRNKILVVDYIEGPIAYDSERDNSRAILKGASLKKNIHQLLSKRADSDTVEFNYMLEQYYEQAECLFYITKWLQDNLSQILPLEDTVKGLFRMQLNYHKAHFETVLKHFYPKREDVPKGNFNLAEILEASFPKLSEQYGIEKKQLTKPDTLVREEVLTEKPPALSTKEKALKKGKKEPIITEKEAETILLKRIFNIG